MDIPPITQQGDLNTVEGIISRVAEQLRLEQPYRKETCPEVYEQVEAFCQRIDRLASGEEIPFTFIVDDPSGNSFIENPYLPKVGMSEIVNLRKIQIAVFSTIIELGSSIWFACFRIFILGTGIGIA